MEQSINPGYGKVADAPLEHDNNQVSTSTIWQVITASSVGTVIEWYDFYIFGSLAAIIGPVLFGHAGKIEDTLLGALAVFGAGFVVRPFGAMFFGRLGDMIGRKYTFLVTLLIMGGATFVTGLIPSYDTIGVAAPVVVVILRLLQGLALGGEYGGATTYVAEYAPDKKRGYYTSFIQITATGGLILSISVLLITRKIVGEDAFKEWGWRIPFLLSGFLVIASYYIRRKLHESPLFAKAKATGTTSKSPLRDSFMNPVNRRLVLIALFGVTMGQGVIFYTSQFQVFTFMNATLKLDIVDSSIIMVVSMLLATPLFVYFGSLSDRIGRKRIIMTGMICGALFTAPLFYGVKAFAGPLTEITPATVDAAGKAVPAVMKALTPNIPAMTALIFCLVLFVTMVYGPIAAYLVELFPTKVRYTSLSVPYHIGNGIFGGFVPLVATSIGVWAATQPEGTFAKEHSSLLGLIYPITVALICFVVGMIYMKDIRNVRLMDERVAE
ncbi:MULTISPECIES: MFS transporter [Hymenobacter]|uniref:MHS family MFS transporter n=2 Tax=Hymenobacter TaxID=89966 RepID=A0ABS6X130_9BACT|nr:MULTISPECIES: MFS transporter [Hymenobacter]MBO3269514.1 MHS family MFS transporter [Hymenobacter defluvii]MBW3128743.1 MHS family MFS transporter [Hymenobacter profundi]QNE39186.1 MHS family MFS transporter [Hymenobacter sp. NBH84]